uniref:tRNA (34-2'-O)-methyltransferase regulator WDR6 n=1 Tax=Caenorhabditis angaria TaxID=860376 RepID=A0A9P1I723_9PELO|nr:unnamed protein product [Caenorhabditis angaria]
MRLNSGNLGRNEEVLEAANFAQIFFEDFEENGSKTAIFCADNDIGRRKNEFVKRVKQLFPENIIGCKKLGNKDIVVLTSRSVLNVLDPKDFSVKKSIQCDYFATSLCSYIYGDSLDSLQIFIGSVEGDLMEWKLKNENKKPIRRKGHKGMIFAISADSQNIFTISDDRTLRMWKIEEDSGCLCTVYGHTARPFSICVDEANQMIFTGGIEQTIFVWKYSENSIELVRKIGLSIGTIRSIVQIENSKLLVGSYEGALVTVNISPIEKSFEICKNVQNFAYLSEKLVILDDTNNLTVFKNEKMAKILFRAENIRYLTSDSSSSSNSVAAWNNEKFVIFMNEMNVLSLKMSSNVISIIVSGCYFLVKLVDGFVRLYSLSDSQNLKYLKKFKLAKPSMIPSKFIIIDDFLVFGTTHGELYYIQISTSSSSPENVIKNRKIEKSLFGDKEISKIHKIEDLDDGIFMVLAKNGTWSTFQITENREILLLNSRSFSANMRITWPCEFLEIYDRNYIVGFHGTSLVIWDTIKGISCFEIYCGGGNREWKMRENETNEVFFDYLSHGILRRQKIDLEMVEYSADIPHSSSIVSASGSRNYLATVSLDGILSISSKLSGDSSNFQIDFSMFAGENLLCVDIFESSENPAEIWVITGGGKSTFGIWKFLGTNFERNIFWHRNYCEDSDEGRVVAVKFVEKNRGEFGQEFVVSFSSGAIFTFSIENNEIIAKNRIRLDENVGIGAKIEIRKGQGENYEILVGTSGSYLICYRIDGKNVEKIWQKRLDDRSGVTALCFSTKSEIIIGFDSGNVITSQSSSPDSFQILHKHLSTVVGIVEKDSNIYSVSLDCQIKNNEGKCENTRINMPNGMTKTDNCIIVIGDGLETF